MVAVLKIGGGEGGGVQQGDEQSAEGRDRGPLKGRVNRKGEGGALVAEAGWGWRGASIGSMQRPKQL